MKQKYLHWLPCKFCQLFFKGFSSQGFLFIAKALKIAQQCNAVQKCPPDLDAAEKKIAKNSNFIFIESLRF